MELKQTLIASGIIIFSSNVAVITLFDSDLKASTTHSKQATEQGADIECGYSGSTYSTQWRRFSGDAALCGSDERQIPVNLSQNQRFTHYSVPNNGKAIIMPLSYNGLPVQINDNRSIFQCNAQTYG